MTATHYRRSNGEMVEIATMEHTHLVASRDKLIRESDLSDDDANETVLAMNAQIAANEARFAEQRTTLEGSGVYVAETPSERNGAPGFQAYYPNGELIAGTWARGDGAPWGLAWKKVYGDAQP